MLPLMTTERYTLGHLSILLSPYRLRRHIVIVRRTPNYGRDKENKIVTRIPRILIQVLDCKDNKISPRIIIDIMRHKEWHNVHITGSLDDIFVYA
jgi:hypothetical protein